MRSAHAVPMWCTCTCTCHTRLAVAAVVVAQCLVKVHNLLDADLLAVRVGVRVRARARSRVEVGARVGARVSACSRKLVAVVATAGKNQRGQLAGSRAW